MSFPASPTATWNSEEGWIHMYAWGCKLMSNERSAPRSTPATHPTRPEDKEQVKLRSPKDLRSLRLGGGQGAVSAAFRTCSQALYQQNPLHPFQCWTFIPLWKNYQFATVARKQYHLHRGIYSSYLKDVIKFYNNGIKKTEKWILKRGEGRQGLG